MVSVLLVGVFIFVLCTCACVWAGGGGVVGVIVKACDDQRTVALYVLCSFGVVGVLVGWCGLVLSNQPTHEPNQQETMNK